ncbi:MAG: PKD domain-containing protein, partial [Bacteroidia bacterium]|nr:PKD domain-containing protein [Bacteroidia bacterium]
MKRLSNWTLLLGLLMLPLLSFAQFFPVTGQVLDSNGQPMASVMVSLDYPTTSGGWGFDSTFTDLAGQFAFPPMTYGSQGVMIITADCGATSAVMDTLFYNPATTGLTTTLTCGATGNICDASFQYFPIQQIGGSIVVFSSTGNSPNNLYSWSFGNGATSSLINPTQFYSPGTYTACLTVYGNNCVDTVCQTFTITGPACVAQWYSSPSGVGLGVYFSADTSLSATATYAWDFGDGSTATGPYQLHTYAVADSYLVCMVMSDPSIPCSDTLCQWVVATPPTGCQADFSSFVSPVTPAQPAVSFTPITSGQAVSFQWSFGDGTSSTQATPTHVYSSSGVYTVCLTITYQNGCVATNCKPVVASVSNTPCDATFQSIITGPGQWLFLANDTSQVNITNYFWSYGDGGTSSGPAGLHAYAANGSYNVCLVVENIITGCVDSTCQQVNVTNAGGASCQASFSYQTGAGLQVYFANQSSGVTPNSSFIWDLG